MDTDVLNIIRKNILFSSLDDAGLKKLAEKFHHVSLPKNKFLFRQGELSDGLYLLVQGRIIISFKTKFKEKKILREVRPGETLGEIGAFSHEPRGASAKTLDDVIVLQLKHNDFFALCRDYPNMLVQTMTILEHHAHALVDLLSMHEPEKKHIALIPANKDASIKEFAELIAKNIQKLDGIVLLSDYDHEFTKKYKTKSEIEDLIQKLHKKNEKILYALGLEESILSKVCFERADIAYLVGCGNAKAHINPIIHKQIKSGELTYKVKPELILLYEKETHMPHHTAQWLKLLDFNLQHHVRLYKDTDIQRILRFLNSRAIGLVLGGGGARSWAHIGAIKALMEADVPIDMICGTSGGAIVAGYYALNETYVDKNAELTSLTKITHTAVSLRHLTWPAISIFDAEAYTQMQKKIFGNTKIENLWVPFFCVSCNLHKSAPVVHKRGLLWKKVRASTSVPGIFPPVVINGQIHMDGGIVNNLPVDLMRKLSGSIGTVIAVELIHTKNGEKKYHFPMVLPLGKTLLAKLKIKYKDYKFPSFIDTFLKSLLAGSSAKQNENAQAADILVSPDLSPFDLMRVSDKQQRQLLELGYQETLTALNKPRKKPLNSNHVNGVRKHETDNL